MHRSIAIAILGVSVIVLGLVEADAAGQAAPVKIAYVDLQRTLHETNAGKQARDRLEKEKQQELQKAAQDLDKQRQVLKPDVLKKRERELQEQYVKLQETYMKLQQELAQEEAKLVREIFAKAAPVIQQIAKSKGYTMVLEKNESAVLFADPSLDITAEVNKLVK